jgi:hypothetical protein
MARLRVFLSRLFGFFSGNTRDDADLRTEIDAHIAEAADEYVRQGLTKEDARRAALRQFGGVTQTIEAHRAQRRFTLFSTLWQDLRYAVRTLTCAPGFAISLHPASQPALPRDTLVTLSRRLTSRSAFPSKRVTG